ncbi:MAG: DMT family transporter [Pseudomonadota bacterium]
MTGNTINTRMGVTEWAMLIGLSILWGGSFFFVEIALREWPPLSIVAARVVLATVALWAVALIARWPIPTGASAWTAFFVLGLTNNVLPFLLITWGQKTVASGLAAILNASAPIFTVIVAGVFLRDERISTMKVAGAVLGLAGVAILVGPGAMGEGASGLLASVAILGAALSYAVAGVYARRLPAMGVNPVVASAGQLLMSSIIMLALFAVFERPSTLAATSAGVWAAVVALAVLSTSFAYILYFRLIESAGATNAILVTLLIPVTAILLGWMLLGERLGIAQFAGMAVIAAGLLLIDGRLPGVVMRARRTR